MKERTAALTGAWSFSGQHIAPRLLAEGWQLRSITNRRPLPQADQYNGRIRASRYTRDVDQLARDLDGCNVLVSNFWTRHDKPPIGHRGAWLSHLQAVDQSAVLLEAAAKANVKRVVWTSITNPGLDPDLSYFAGKGIVEQLVRGSGPSYAILRPACFFGGGGILIDNVAWAARRMPIVPIPNGPAYRIRPIHVKDYAELVVAAMEASNSYTIDAVGRDQPEFRELIAAIAKSTNGRGKPIRLPMAVCRAGYAAANRMLGETVLSADELTGLARNRLDTNSKTTGSTRLMDWIETNGAELGQRFRREPARPWAK